jgi:hypothetical protein
VKATPATPQGCEAEPAVGADQHAGGGGDALAALEAEENRKQVPEEGGQAGGRCGDGAELHGRSQACCGKYGQPALEGVAHQREDGGELVAAAEHVGGPGLPEP